MDSIKIDTGDASQVVSETSGPKTAISTPSVSRRSSFLSQTMLDSESFSIYDTYSYARGQTSYHVISLKESQGFMFNQDLFASAYQQSRAHMREKQERALFSKKRSKSHGNVLGSSNSQVKRQQQRRYTSFSSAPLLQMRGDDNAIDEMSSEDEMCIENFSSNQDRVQAAPPATLPKAMSFSEGPKIIDENHEFDFENPMSSFRVGTWSDASDDSESDENHATFSSIGSNFVPVIDISVDDMDHIPDL